MKFSAVQETYNLFKRYNRTITLILLVVIFMALSRILIAPAIQLMVNKAWTPPHPNPEYGLWIPIFIIIISLVHAAGRFFQGDITEHCSLTIDTDFKEKIIQKVLTKGYEQKIDPGHYISLINTDTFWTGQMPSFLTLATKDILVAIGGFAYLLYIDVKLTLISGGALLVISIVTKQNSKKIQKYATKSMKQLDKIIALVKKVPNYSEIIKAFQLDQTIIQKYKKLSRNYLNFSRKRNRSNHLTKGTMEAGMAFLLGGLFLYMGKRITNQSLSIGDFTGFLIASGTIFESFKSLTQQFVAYKMFTSHFERIYNFLNSESNEKPEDLEYGKPFPQDWSVIRFENVTFKYPETTRPALHKASFTIHRNSKNFITGESGSGKSTIIKMIMRLIDPTTGVIYFDDMPITEIKKSDLRKNISLIAQSSFLFDESVAENISYGQVEKDPPLSKEQIVEVAQKALCDDFIKERSDQYETIIDAQKGNFSGGESQRIGIARSLIRKSSITLADEATSSLDPDLSSEVQANIYESAQTLIFVSHQLQSISKFKNANLIHIDQGHITYTGPLERFFSQNPTV